MAGVSVAARSPWSFGHRRCDVRRVAWRIVPRLLFAAAAVAGAFVAFFRGNYLLGLGCGIEYAAIALALFWLFARSRTPAGGVSVLRVVFVLVFALTVAFTMAFPASISPGVRFSIDRQATDRRARAELAAVFESDPAYRDMSVSAVHLKVVNITVRGSLRTRADLNRLRSRIASECPALGECFLHWDVILRDSGQQVGGLDGDLLREAEPSHAPEPAAGPVLKSTRIAPPA
jgi:hypothetical protein